MADTEIQPAATSVEQPDEQADQKSKSKSKAKSKSKSKSTSKSKKPDDAVKLGCGGFFRRRKKKSSGKAADAAEAAEESSKVPIEKQKKAETPADEAPQTDFKGPQTETGESQETAQPEGTVQQSLKVLESTPDKTKETTDKGAQQLEEIVDNQSPDEQADKSAETPDQGVKTNKENSDEKVTQAEETPESSEHPHGTHQDKEAAKSEKADSEDKKTRDAPNIHQQPEETSDKQADQPEVTSDKQADQPEETSDKQADQPKNNLEKEAEETPDTQAELPKRDIFTNDTDPRSQMWSNIVNNSLIGTGVFSRASVSNLETGAVFVSNPTAFAPSLSQVAALRDNFDSRGALSGAGFGVGDTVYRLQEETSTPEILTGVSQDSAEGVLVTRTNTALLVCAFTKDLDQAVEMLAEMRKNFISQGH